MMGICIHRDQRPREIAQGLWSLLLSQPNQKTRNPEQEVNKTLLPVCRSGSHWEGWFIRIPSLRVQEALAPWMVSGGGGVELKNHKWCKHHMCSGRRVSSWRVQALAVAPMSLANIGLELSTKREYKEGDSRTRQGCHTLSFRSPWSPIWP